MNPNETTPSDEYDLRLAEFWLLYEAAPNAAAKEAVVADYCARNPDLKGEVTAQLGLRSRIEPETVPERIERFPIRRVIDRGGMGRVFEAEQEPLGRLVAVKTIREDRNDLLHRVRFHNERRTLARLHHTHIVPIYAAGREGHLDYYAMPLIDGASLRRLLDLARRLAASAPAASLPGLSELVRLACQPAVDSQASPNGALVWRPSSDYLRSVVGVMADAADALEHAHRQGYLHRDVKPSNIMVDLRGHCWVVDFGLAPLRDLGRGLTDGPEANGHDAISDLGPELDRGTTIGLDSEVAQYQAALTSGTVGSPAYMAPEQRHGTADPRSDVWGLGVTFYELLTGRQAHPGPGSSADLLAPRAVVPSLPRDLDAICRKAARPEPSQRYATAGDLRDDLRCWLDRRPTRARPAWPLHRAWLWARRNKGWAAALVVTVAALTSAGVIRGNLEASTARGEAALAEARARDLKRENLIQQIERLRLSAHRNGWSAEAWDLVRQAAAIRTDDALQFAAAGCLAGYDARVVQEFTEFGAAALAFDRDGRRLLIGSVTDAKRPDPNKPLPARLWDFKTRTMTIFSAAAIGPVAFRGDATPVQLVPGTEKDGAAVILLDLPRNKPLSRFIAPGGATFDLTKSDFTLTPDASVAVAVLERPRKGQVLVAWDGATGRMLGNLELDIHVRCIAVSLDGSLVAAAQETGQIVVWSPTTGRTIVTLDNGRNRLNCLSFGRDVRRPEPTAPGPGTPHWLLAAGDSGGTVTVWDVTRHRIASYCLGSNYDVYAVAFSPDGETLASCGRAAAKLWDLRYGRTLIDIGATSAYQLSLAFEPGSRRLAVGAWSMFGPGGVGVWDLDNGRGVRTLYGLRGQVDSTGFSPDGRRVAALSQAFEAGVWDVETGKLLRLLDVPMGLFADNAGLAFSSDGRRFAVVSGERATLWDVETGVVLGSWTLPGAIGDRLAFDGLDRLRLFRCETKTGRVPPTLGYDWKIHPRVLRLRRLTVPDRIEVVREIDDFNIHLYGAAVTPDGSTFLAEGTGSTAGGAVSRSFKAFDGATGRDFWSAPVLSKNSSAIVMIDPDGRVHWREPDNNGGKVLPWPLKDVRTGLALGHIDPAPLALGPGANRWFSRVTDFGGAFTLMEKGHDRPRLLIPAPDSAAGVFGPDGLHFAHGHSDGTVTVLDLGEIQRRLAEFHLGW